MKKTGNNLAKKKRLKKNENKSNFFKKRNIYKYKTLNMKRKKQNEKPFSNGKSGIKIVITFLIVMIFKDNPETLEYILLFSDSILNLILDNIGKKSDDSKTNN